MLRFMEMCTARDRERQRILEAMDGIRLLLSPVSAGPAFRHGAGGYQAGRDYRHTMRHSQWLNLAGFPGVAIPMAPLESSPEGLPVGVQIIARPYEDELALAVAEGLEAARGNWMAPPID
jgi:amidase